MYWEKLKDTFEKIREISENDPNDLYYFAERCRERLCEMLGEEGSLLFEQYMCCLDLLNKKGEFNQNK